MISAGDFRNGVTVEIEGNIYQIIEFMHVKPGKGAAFVRAKLKNIINGGVVERTFRPTEKFETAHIDKRDMTYSYKDGDLYYFMDPESYDMVPVNGHVIEDDMKLYLRLQSVSLVLQETLLQTLQSLVQLRPVLLLMYHSSLTREIQLRLIHVQASTYQEYNSLI